MPSSAEEEEAEEIQDQVVEEETAPFMVDNQEDPLLAEVCREVMEDPWEVAEDLQEAVEGPQVTEDPQAGEIQEQISHDPPITS